MVLCTFIGVHEESEGNAFGAIAGQQQLHAKYTLPYVLSYFMPQCS